jgi:hypothetical protein
VNSAAPHHPDKAQTLSARHLLQRGIVIYGRNELTLRFETDNTAH